MAKGQPKQMEVTQEDGMLVIRIPMVKQPSKSLKSTVIATTGGNKPTPLMIDGQNLVVGVNAYIPRQAA
jgi:hypothetical protein